jgi:UDP-N-acetylglucosamine--N-acetylmuramyl-(pentapeptide) pyrophosphoryl-undecaprenol N-acetylglucosamine transferase
VWLGTRQGLEAKLVPPAGFHMEWISIKGLRGRGVTGWLLLPFRLMIAMGQALSVFLRRRPSVVLSMGGFVAGPGGLIAWLLRRPLVIHEANAIPGFTNRFLALVANRVLCGFPGTFGNRPKVRHVGNPVRKEIFELPAPEVRMAGDHKHLHVLVIGGSQGARALNAVVARTFSQMNPDSRPELWHQCGARWLKETQAIYGDNLNQVRLVEFIEDMAEAYRWADIVLCRSGAMTVAELAAAGVGSILVPFPYATDDHQTANARYLQEHEAAILLPEAECTSEKLQELFITLDKNRDVTLNMAKHARECAMPDADVMVAQVCEELAHA